MARIIYDEKPVFVPMALSYKQARSAFRACQAAFMATHEKDLAQAMLVIGEAIDKVDDEIDAKAGE